jgi:hypothetical protein
MKKTNFGIVKMQVINSLIESFSKGEDALEKISSVNFTEVVKSSPFLVMESIFYKNLENKHIKEENSAARYIDECLSLFDKYTRKDYIKAHSQLEVFNVNENCECKLYRHIDTLLYESLPMIEDEITDVDVLHESFEFVLNHIQTNQPKQQLKESKFDKIKSYFTKEEVLKKSIENFNQKYSNLNESERTIVTVLTRGTLTNKKELFEGLKDENTKLLMKQLASSTNDIINDRIKKSIDKINKMSFTESTPNKDILKLYNLKNNIKD